MTRGMILTFAARVYCSMERTTRIRIKSMTVHISETLCLVSFPLVVMVVLHLILHIAYRHQVRGRDLLFTRLLTFDRVA